MATAKGYRASLVLSGPFLRAEPHRNRGDLRFTLRQGGRAEVVQAEEVPPRCSA
jgi:hypothetical protein